MRHNLWLSLTRNGIGPDGSRACCKLYFYKLVLDHFGQMRHGGLYLERRWMHIENGQCSQLCDRFYRDDTDGTSWDQKQTRSTYTGQSKYSRKHKYRRHHILMHGQIRIADLPALEIVISGH